MATKAVPEAQERVPKPSGVIGQPEPPSAPTASQPVAVTEEMAPAGQTMLGMDRVKPRRSDPVIEVRRSAKVHPVRSCARGLRPARLPLRCSRRCCRACADAIGIGMTCSARDDAKAHTPACTGLGAAVCW